MVEITNIMTELSSGGVESKSSSLVAQQKEFHINNIMNSPVKSVKSCHVGSVISSYESGDEDSKDMQDYKYENCNTEISTTFLS